MTNLDKIKEAAERLFEEKLNEPVKIKLKDGTVVEHVPTEEQKAWLRRSLHDAAIGLPIIIPKPPLSASDHVTFETIEDGAEFVKVLEKWLPAGVMETPPTEIKLTPLDDVTFATDKLTEALARRFPKEYPYA